MIQARIEAPAAASNNESDVRESGRNALQFESVSLRDWQNGLPDPVRVNDSRDSFMHALGDYRTAENQARARGDAEPSGSAFAQTKEQFDSAIRQSQMEYAGAMIRAAQNLGLSSTRPLEDAAREFNAASDQVGHFAKGRTDAEINAMVEGLKQYRSLPPGSPEAQRLAASLPPGLIDATARLDRAINNPVYREYAHTVSPTVLNRLQLLNHYDSIMGRSGIDKSDPYRAQLQREYDDLFKHH